MLTVWKCGMIGWHGHETAKIIEDAPHK